MSAGDRVRAAGRAGRLAVTWAAIGLAAGLLLAVTLPHLAGRRSLTVLSGSMRPTLRVGDIVVVEQIDPRDARVGDVVSFRDPEDRRRLLTHRVRDLGIEGGTVSFVTKGDSNTSVERWQVSAGGTIGRVVYRVPLLGFGLFWARSPLGRILLVVIPAIALGLHELWRIWRPDPREANGAAPA